MDTTIQRNGIYYKGIEDVYPCDYIATFHRIQPAKNP